MCLDWWATMTLFKFTTAAARTGVEAMDIGKSLVQDTHDFPRLAAAADEASHDFHWVIDMMKKIFEPGAQVI
jgi:hypothetical protein